MKTLQVCLCLIIAGTHAAIIPSLPSISANASLKPPQLMMRAGSYVQCGLSKRKSDIAQRIVGGMEVRKNEIPWQISLQYKKTHICGGVVIDRDWVMTAAHCMRYIDPLQLQVVAGDHLLFTEDKEQHRGVEAAIIHSKYVAATNENDIVLLHLSEPLVFDGLTVLPVCLPSSMADVSGFCEVSGWGFTREGGNKSDILRKVMVPVMSDVQCRTEYTETPRKVTDNMICAGFADGRKDACQADSGGPLTCLGQDDRRFLIGLVSWGIGCAQPHLPGVYTEVSHFVEWIDSVTSNYSSTTQPTVHATE